MIRLIGADGVHHPLSGYRRLHIKHKLDGCDTLTFYLDTAHEQYPLIAEECRILAADNSWLVKKIDDDRITCELDFDFLKGRFYRDYKSETRLLTQVLAQHLPDGWTIENGNVSTIRRSISFDYCTDYDVVYQCMHTYGVYFVWHIPEKRVVVHNPDMEVPTGEYLTTELNLKALSFKGSTSDFATRMYAYGADGMTMEDAIVDGRRYGLQYVDDNTYSDKVVVAYWADERYTVPENLYADTKAKLAAMANPVRSYSCDAEDLAARDPRYSFLDFAMHKVITLIDRDRGVRVNHQIVEYDEYPDGEDDNKITLASVPATIKTRTARIAEQTTEEIAQSSNYLESRINMATAMLTGVFGGHVYSDGSEIFIMDTADPNTAQVVWRWNINGFGKSSTGIQGPYTTAMTFDDTFITSLIEGVVIRGEYIIANSIAANKLVIGDVAEELGEEGTLALSSEAIRGVAVYYALSAYSTVETPGEAPEDISDNDWSTVAPDWTQGMYMWQKTVTTYADGNTSESFPTCISGAVGQDGVGVESVEVSYALTTTNTVPVSGWQPSMPSVEPGKYLWQRTVTIYEDQTTSTSYLASYFGEDGDDGTPGDSYYVHFAYSTSADGSENFSTTTFTGAVYIGVCTDTTRQDPQTYTSYAWSKIKGEDGTNGRGISSVVEYYLATTESSGVTRAHAGWTNAVQHVSSAAPYLWNYEHVNYTDGTSYDTDPALIGNWSEDGDDGRGIANVVEHYLASALDSGVTTETPGWTTTVQTITPALRYLWNYEVVTYTDGTSAVFGPAIIGVYGVTGRGVVRITNYYLATASDALAIRAEDYGDGDIEIITDEFEAIDDGDGNITIPENGRLTVTDEGVGEIEMESAGISPDTPGWSEDVTTQTIDATKPYLWNYEEIEYSDGTIETTTPFIIATYTQDGRGIVSITEYYLVSDQETGVTISGNTWYTVPQISSTAYPYIWNYEAIVFTDSDTPVCTTPRVIGVHGATGPQGPQGEQGIQGPAGADGDTTYFHIKYSAVANPAASDMTETPSTYIGTYVDTTALDSSDPADYTWARFQGLQGEQGEQGIPGTDGTDGTTYYLHIKYSDDGGQTFTGNSGEEVGEYMGTCVDTTQADPTTVASYTWAKIKGEDGRGVSGITEYYAKSSDSTTAPVTGWSTAVPTLDATDKFLWNYETIHYTDGTSPSTTPAVIGVFGADGAAGRSITGVTEHYLATSASSGVTKNTSGWTTSIQTIDATNKYLWNYETISYSSGNPTDTTPVIIGTYGEKGDTGDSGPQGVGVTSVVEEYILSTSNTTAPSGSAAGWSETCPAWESGKYIWIRVKTTLTNGTVTTSAPTLANALNSANSTAYSRAQVYYQTDAPSNPKTNDVWYKIAYSGSAVPTNSNSPASSWTTNALKAAHLGDLYYCSGNGYYYTYASTASGYTWVIAQSSDGSGLDRMYVYVNGSWVQHKTGTTSITDGAITTDLLAAQAVTAAKVQTNSLTVNCFAQSVQSSLATADAVASMVNYTFNASGMHVTVGGTEMITLGSDGSLYAGNATLTGSLTTNADGNGSTAFLYQYGLRFDNGLKQGTLAVHPYLGVGSDYGLAFLVSRTSSVMGTEAMKHLSIGIANAGDSGYVAGYVLNNGLNPDGYTERNLMYGGLRIDGVLYDPTLLRNFYTSRPSTADMPITGSGGMSKFLATSSMSAKPGGCDAHILHMFWDNLGGWDSQLAVTNGDDPHVYIRGQNSGTWGVWRAVLDSGNYSTYALPRTGGYIGNASTVWIRETDDNRGNIQIFKPGSSGNVLAINLYANQGNAGGEIDLHDYTGTRKVAIYAGSDQIGRVRTYSADGYSYTAVQPNGIWLGYNTLTQTNEGPLYCGSIGASGALTVAGAATFNGGLTVPTGQTLTARTAKLGQYGSDMTNAYWQSITINGTSYTVLIRYGG